MRDFSRRERRLRHSGARLIDMRFSTVVLGLASLLPLANSFAADPKLVKAVSDHFEIYTTDNEASAKAALEPTHGKSR